MPQPAQLLTILRQPYALQALLTGPCATPAASTLPAQEIPGDDGAPLTTLPFAQVALALYPRHALLLRAWRRLAQVRTLDAEVLCALLVVLLETIPDDWALASGLPSLEVMPQSQVPVATAAHPRAFRGTTYQPPKPRQPMPQDWRPYLNDAQTVRRLLTALDGHLPLALAELTALGYAPATVARVRQTATGAYQPLVLGLPPALVRPGAPALPRRFLREILPSIKALDAPDIRAYLALFHTLALDDDHALRHAISHLVHEQPTARTLAWCRVVEYFPAPRRLACVTHLLAGETYQADPAPMTPAVIDAFHCLVPERHYDAWLSLFLQAIRMHVTRDYVLAGLRLAGTLAPDETVTLHGDCPDFPYEVVEELALTLPDHYPPPGWCALRAWERCAQVPGFAAVLRQTPWQRLTPAIARQYLEGLLDLTVENGVTKWTAITRYLPQIVHLIQTTAPPYQERGLRELLGFLWQWDTPAELHAFFPDAAILSRRLAAAPFRPESEVAHLLASLLETQDAAQRASVLRAPDSSLRALERHSRRDNDDGLLARGLYALTRVFRDLAIRAFLHVPHKLCATAMVLGGMSQARCLAMLRHLTHHPLFAQPIDTMPVHEVCTLLPSLCAGRYANPVPRYLAAWAQGRYTLTPARIARYHRVVLAQLDLTRLDCITHHALDTLAQGLPVAPPMDAQAHHALRLLGRINANRRGLRRFLQAHWRGDTDYLQRHPATQAWLRQHPSVDMHVWTTGMAFQPPEAVALGLSLGVERDPLEVLRLGTYVGTCLGLGGLFDYSAAAVVLDLNKQVLYARNAQGHVVARQLVALSEEEHLICFQVYPESTPSSITALFRAYDVAWAHTLGLPLYVPADATDYTIADILSERWWDDGAWEA